MITPEQLARYRANRAAQTARYRQRHPHRRCSAHTRRHDPDRRERNLAEAALREWIAVDGEGWGVDEHGRQCYRLMTAATDSGFEDSLPALGERLPTIDMLEWLCWLVQHYREWCRRQGRRYVKPRLAGYGLGYDYAHILLDLPLESLAAVFHNQDHDAPWVEFEGFLLKLTAGRLQVKRLSARRQRGYADLWDCYRYFKGTFAAASAHLMTPEEKVLIEAGKARRGETEHSLADETVYALTECHVMSRLMKTLTEQAASLDLHPTSWYGPGSLAHLALKQNGVAAHYVKDEDQPPELVAAALRAFVAGRFETTGHGRLPFLMQYDIRSAYPFGITRLPCLTHTRWQHIETRGLGFGLIADWQLSRVRWDNHGEPLKGGWGPWATRVQPGKVMAGEDGFDAQMLPVWPWAGESWVWGPELRAGAALLAHSPQATYEITEAWVPETSCACQPFAWVEEWYYRRLALAAAGDPREWWLKLILNSLYGKMAQQVGRPQWHSWLWAGMITAHTHAQLLQAIALDPEAVVMTATDAVYSRRGLDLPMGAGLGEWDYQALGRAFVIQSGFYNAEAIYDDTRPRTRGLPPRYISWPIFETRWDEVLAGKEAWDAAKVVIDKDPETGKPFQIHIGIGLAQLWGKPEKLGSWQDYPTEITFVTDKRPFAWRDAPAAVRAPQWLPTRPWYQASGLGAEYRSGRGIGEDKFAVMDQPNAGDWGDL